MTEEGFAKVALSISKMCSGQQSCKNCVLYHGNKCRFTMIVNNGYDEVVTRDNINVIVDLFGVVYD